MILLVPIRKLATRRFGFKPVSYGADKQRNRLTTAENLYLLSNQQISTQFASISILACSLIGMSTERQQQASRINGSKSRGATTPEGKLASSRNALKHGMLSSAIVLDCESTDRFHILVTTLFEEFQPQTPFEESLIENMAVARWRQARIWAMEKAGIEHEMRRQAGISNSISTEDSATRASRAFRTLSDNSRSLELINRYDSRYERQYYRAHRRFLEVRDLRTPPSGQPASRECRPDDRTFPTGGTEKIHEMPAPVNPPPTPETPAPEKVAESKGTREVTANKPSLLTFPGSPCTDSHLAASAFQPQRRPHSARTRRGRRLFRALQARAVA